MLERTRPTQQLERGGGGGAPDGPDGSLMATVANWPYSERLPVAGMTIMAIRHRYSDRFDIDPASQAVVDGNVVADETATTLAPGQMLLFVRRAGEKGTVVIEDHCAQAVSPEGQRRTIELPALLRRMTPLDGIGEMILPDGIKAILPRGKSCIWVCQLPPAVHNFRWIANDSRAKYGPGTKYRQVRIGLPYIVVLAVFTPGEDGQVNLSGRNECFFRNSCLRSMDDDLCYPALLNVSKFKEDGREHPLAWICTQHLNYAELSAIEDLNARMRAGFTALLNTLLATAFNLSSEMHEGASWFGESRRADPRISTVENWEKATTENPLFVLDVPWLSTKHTLRQVTERTFKALNAADAGIRSAQDIERLIFNAH